MKAKDLVIIAAVSCGVAFGVFQTESKETVTAEYCYTVQEGDTVYGICTKIATKYDDINRLVYETLRQNDIKDASKLEVGREIRVKVNLQEGK